jgi:hypothetical protein
VGVALQRIPAFLFLAAIAAMPAQAQEQPTISEALAELIHDAMPPTAWSGPHDTWDAVSIRISSLMHWHLAPPDTGDETAIERRGWLSAGGRRVGITAYGAGENVISLGFERGDDSYGSEPAPDHRELLAALAARGITVNVVERRDNRGEPPFPIASTAYTLAAAGRENVRFTSATHCTPPGSRAARRCWVTHDLILGD